MPENKHAQISIDLEQAVRSGQYFERIPPVRILAAQYGVSLQTMTKALKPLQRSGLLVSGPGGTRIMENIPYKLNSGIVTIFMLDDTLPEKPLGEDPLLQSLRAEAAREGVTLVTMWVSDENIFHKQSFWQSRQTDGYIFIYSSFYPLISKQLQISGVPYLAANWMPESFNVHWIDWDWKKELFELVKQLKERNYSKIAYLPHIHWKFGEEFHYDMWQDVCSSYDLYNYLPDESFFGSEPLQQLERIAADPAGAPEVILPFNIPEKNLLAKLDELKLDCRIYMSSNGSEKLKDPRLFYHSTNDYDKLGKEIWKLFRQISSGKAGKPRGHWVGNKTIKIPESL